MDDFAAREVDNTAQARVNQYDHRATRRRYERPYRQASSRAIQRSVSQRAPPVASNEPSNASHDKHTRQNRSSTVSQTVSGPVSRLVGRLTPMATSVTPTPAWFIIKTVKDLGNCSFQARDEYRTVKTFTNSSEAEVSIVRSRSTRKTFVFKHTYPLIRDEDHGKTPEQIKTWKRCNEAHILGGVLKAYRNVVNLIHDEEDREEPGRYKLMLEHCTGGDLINAIDRWRKRRGLVPEQFVLHLFIEMAQALAAIHHGFRYRGDGKWYKDEFYHSVVHGDFKEDQIFLRWAEKNIGGMPELVLGDFGVTKVVGRRSTVNVGTFIFHAPEDKAVYGDTSYTYENRQVFYDMVNSRTVASDVYALGQVMYVMAGRESNYWPTGQDPATLEISGEYSTPGLKEAVKACLAVDPVERAEMSFEKGVGLLPAIEKLRSARDAMMERRGPLDRFEFDPAFGRPKTATR